MIEPLVEVDYAKKEYYGVLAESGNFRVRSVFHLRKAFLSRRQPFTQRRIHSSIVSRPTSAACKRKISAM
jgi:hypothetical protein